MITNGVNVNMLGDTSVDRDGSVLDYCRLHDITIQPWSPFQYGFFEGVFLGSDKYPELNRAIDEVAGAIRRVLDHHGDCLAAAASGEDAAGHGDDEPAIASPSAPPPGTSPSPARSGTPSTWPPGISCPDRLEPASARAAQAASRTPQVRRASDARDVRPGAGCRHGWWPGSVGVAGGCGGLDDAVGWSSAAPVGCLFAQVAGFAEALTVSEAGVAALAVGDDVVDVPDRRVAPGCPAGLVSGDQESLCPGREQPLSGVHGHQLGAGWVRVEPADPGGEQFIGHGHVSVASLIVLLLGSNSGADP